MGCAGCCFSWGLCSWRLEAVMLAVHGGGCCRGLCCWGLYFLPALLAVQAVRCVHVCALDMPVSWLHGTLDGCGCQEHAARWLLRFGWAAHQQRRMRADTAPCAAALLQLAKQAALRLVAIGPDLRLGLGLQAASAIAHLSATPEVALQVTAAPCWPACCLAVCCVAVAPVLSVRHCRSIPLRSIAALPHHWPPPQCSLHHTHHIHHSTHQPPVVGVPSLYHTLMCLPASAPPQVTEGRAVAHQLLKLLLSPHAQVCLAALMALAALAAGGEACRSHLLRERGLLAALLDALHLGHPQVLSYAWVTLGNMMLDKVAAGQLLSGLRHRRSKKPREPSQAVLGPQLLGALAAELAELAAAAVKLVPEPAPLPPAAPAKGGIGKKGGMLRGLSAGGALRATSPSRTRPAAAANGKAGPPAAAPARPDSPASRAAGEHACAPHGCLLLARLERCSWPW